MNDQDALCGNELVSSSVGARDSIYKELLVEVSCISCQASKQDFKKKLLIQNSPAASQVQCGKRRQFCSLLVVIDVFITLVNMHLGKILHWYFSAVLCI